MKYVLVAMPQVLWFLLTPALLLSQLVPVPAVAPVSDMAPAPMPAPPPGCPGTCGKVDIPYPFGIGDNCAWPGFTLTCNHSSNPPRLYLGNIEVIDMTLETGEMRVSTPVSYNCYNPSSTSKTGITWWVSLGSPFLISSERNVFTAIGCSTLAYLVGRDDSSYFTGCITTCESVKGAAKNGAKCTGLGCCQAPILSNLSRISVAWGNDVNNTVFNSRAWRYSPCSYAFVAEKGWYRFSRKDLNGTGDINECELWKSDPKRYGKQYLCKSGSTCRDTDGDYECKCNWWEKGDGKSDMGCQPVLPPTTLAIVATFCAVIFLGILLCFIRREHKTRKQRRFFAKNGGEILKSMNINIFTQAQLEKITDHYNTPIGEGAFGKVFLGTIIGEGAVDGNQRVAVKRSIAKGEEQLGQDDFVNEITTQFRISHTNLVQLIGCCLETDVPMLVFEFIPNGSLHNVLHAAKKHILSLPERLDIAIGSAEALTYMHSHSKIFHGDVKSGNILLDENFKPKVSDFGSSKHELITRYKKWSVMGDMNYIDPAYIKTSDFTEKSDVYSFGVVLLELITQKKPKYDGSKSLSMNFMKSYKDEGARREMYDQEIFSASQPHYMKCLDMFSDIAVQCLKEDVDDRPTMSEVVKQLELVKLIKSP